MSADLSQARRYRAVMIKRGIVRPVFAVKCGDGRRSLFVGSPADCERVANELEIAFRDGLYVGMGRVESSE